VREILARACHRPSAGAADAPRPAAFSPHGVLDVPSSTTPRPSGRTPHWARHLGVLATKTGEKCGLALVTVVAAAVAVACSGDKAPSTDPRLELLERAFAIRQQDPDGAGDLFANAGRGAFLERARLEAWLEVLELGDADAGRWRILVEDLPPSDIAARASLGLAEALVDGGEILNAVAVLETVPGKARIDADVILVSLGDGAWRESAARRLAVSAPHRLRGAAPEFEDQVTSDLSVEEWLERTSRWRDAGWPRTAAAELRGLRWQGDAERRRRLAAASAELEAGSTSRALRLLPSVGDSETEALVLRAEAYRQRGWQRVPDAGARRAFVDCLEVANRALATGGGDAAALVAGARLVLECGTESGDLDQALAAWQRLEAVGWQDERREWLGRRLGVAFAQRGGDVDVVRDLAGALPGHERCLRFWQAWTADEGNGQLRRLAGAPLADVYGSWARRSLGLAPPSAVQLTPAVEPGPLPASVAWLMDHDGAEQAMREWRRIATARRSTPREALAAASHAAAIGDNNDSIRWLRSGFPELGTVDMWRAPSNAVLSYLPLRWLDDVIAAARQADVEPWLLAAVGRQETVFTARARSPRGAIGVLQLLPDTAKMHSRALGFGSTPDLYDPQVNLRLGARELARLLERFEAVEPALAAYNGGETRVRRWWRRWSDERQFTEAIPIPETYNYVRRVCYLAEAYRLVYSEEWGRSP
jgi:soluble lytic murein transglycosylase